MDLVFFLAALSSVKKARLVIGKASSLGQYMQVLD